MCSTEEVEINANQLPKVTGMKFKKKKKIIRSPVCVEECILVMFEKVTGMLTGKHPAVIFCQPTHTKIDCHS